MKKYLLLTATAALALASCTSDDFVGTDQERPQAESTAIAFGPQTGKAQRADHVGADAAALLNNNFVVEGIRVNQDDDQVEVFDHYNVNYTASTANTTESNSSDWEYVGIGKHGLSHATTQAIKFWNYESKQYDFIAFSYGKSNYEKSVLTTMDYANLGKPVYDSDGDPIAANAVYTVTGKAEELAKCYIADLVTLYNRDHVSEFGKDAVVTPKFRALGTKVRLAFYETVPGYAVSNVKFYDEAWDESTATSDEGETTPTLFAASAVFPSATSTGTMSVYFPTVGWENSTNGTLSPDYNQAHITFAAGSESGDALVTTKTFGALNYTATAEGGEICTDILGRTSATATYAGDVTAADHAYQTVLPLGTKDNLQIRIEYDLYPIDGSEDVIHVRDARAVVPAAYADWKPNYAYTYIFKISDNTNGWTGVDGEGDVVEGLTPITFDAVVVDTEDGIQETITTVATPSITTYQEGKVVNEYTAGEIYATVMDGTAKNTGISLYVAAPKAGAPAGTTVTEKTAELAYTMGKTDPSSDLYDKTNVHMTQVYGGTTVAAVPGADGNDITIPAYKWTATASTTYVLRYDSGSKVAYKVIRVQ